MVDNQALTNKTVDDNKERHLFEIPKSELKPILSIWIGDYLDHGPFIGTRPGFLSKVEAAQRLRMSLDILREYTEREWIRCFEIHNTVCYLEIDLIESLHRRISIQSHNNVRNPQKERYAFKKDRKAIIRHQEAYSVVESKIA